MFTKALLDIHCNTLIDSMVVFIAGVSTLFDNQLDNSTNMVLQMWKWGFSIKEYTNLHVCVFHH